MFRLKAIATAVLVLVIFVGDPHTVSAQNSSDWFHMYSQELHVSNPQILLKDQVVNLTISGQMATWEGGREAKRMMTVLIPSYRDGERAHLISLVAGFGAVRDGWLYRAFRYHPEGVDREPLCKPTELEQFVTCIATAPETQPEGGSQLQHGLNFVTDLIRNERNTTKDRVDVVLVLGAYPSDYEDAGSSYREAGWPLLENCFLSMTWLRAFGLTRDSERCEAYKLRLIPRTRLMTMCSGRRNCSPERTGELSGTENTTRDGWDMSDIMYRGEKVSQHVPSRLRVFLQDARVVLDQLPAGCLPRTPHELLCSLKSNQFTIVLPLQVKPKESMEGNGVLASLELEVGVSTNPLLLASAEARIQLPLRTVTGIAYLPSIGK